MSSTHRCMELPEIQPSLTTARQRPPQMPLHIEPLFKQETNNTGN
ncbi:hypothetical protein I7I53_04572 [Histoplasma capsulatum var. duboisii H88]|uniref:Uncharacterized protein n=1 Tax=Ajellomyces capsulatus (strain H88) TaxID=544711 RepID=A0A8A1LSU3_AJEC8|nr:hypothetical protein I7I53_04572 [Histoplasma capsulatum var. duboisii H88]